MKKPYIKHWNDRGVRLDSKRRKIQALVLRMAGYKNREIGFELGVHENRVIDLVRAGKYDLWIAMRRLKVVAQ